MEILGNRLYFLTSSDELKHYPSPTELKGKILISTKPPKEDTDAAIGTSSTSTEHTQRKMKDRQKRTRKLTLQNDKSSSDEEVLPRWESGYNVNFASWCAVKAKNLIQ